MKPIRPTHLLSIMLLITTVLTGCVTFNTSTTVNQDGSGTNEIRAGFTREFLEFIDEKEPFTEEDLSTDEFPAEWQATAELWEDDTYKGIVLRTHFTNATMLEDQLEQLIGSSNNGMFSDINVTQDGNNISIQATVVQETTTDEELSEYGDMFRNSFSLSWSIELPIIENYTENDIVTRNGNRVTWSFPMDVPETRTYNLAVSGKLSNDVAVETPVQVELPGDLCFNEVDACITGRIRQYWEENGGLAVFGYPTTPLQPEEIEGKVFQVQWFERNRLELHPENARPYDVLLGRLGYDLLLQQGRDWWQFPRSNAVVGDDCIYFDDTYHSVCGNFLNTWRAHGIEIDGQPGLSYRDNLALFGYPLSEPMQETLGDGQEYTVQYFERVRVEYHPENPPEYQMLFGLLGNEIQ